MTLPRSHPTSARDAAAHREGDRDRRLCTRGIDRSPSRGHGYYLQVDGPVAAKSYQLLRMALERSAKVAVAKYARSGRERLGLLRVYATM